MDPPGNKTEDASVSRETPRGSVIHQTQFSIPPAVAETRQYRSVFLLTLKHSTFEGNWALFVPYTQEAGCRTGRRIHVVGNVALGFKQEIIRNYSLDTTLREPTLIEMGAVSAQHLVNIPKDERYTVECTARDPFERKVLSVPAPAKGLKSILDNSEPGLGPPRRRDLPDGQWWVARVVKRQRAIRLISIR